VPREWSDRERVEDYLTREIPHRDIAEQLLLEALPSRVRSFADLGTGAGRLLALVRSEHPRARGLGLDFSQPMLVHARARFAGDEPVELIEHDLTEPLTLIDALRETAPLDAVVSGLAVHHLEHERKRTLFSEIHSLLGPGGVFANLDLATSPTPELHLRFREAIGRVDDDPADRLAGACDQLRWLREAGFTTVDCRFTWLELTLFVARRDERVKI
jgi:tRNA (cmo5U34)-methyltransferase